MSNIDDFIGYEFLGERFDCGSKVGYLKANIAYGLQSHELKDELSSYLGDIKNL
jgi:UTP--glucose-1-phosphate uridylyltransferase